MMDERLMARPSVIPMAAIPSSVEKRSMATVMADPVSRPRTRAFSGGVSLGASSPWRCVLS